MQGNTETAPLSSRVRNFADTQSVSLAGLKNIIAELAVELSRPQMLQMALEIAGSLIDLGTETWGDPALIALYTVENMREAGLRLGDAAQFVKLLRDNLPTAWTPEPSGVSLGSQDSASEETQLVVLDELDKEVSVHPGTGAQEAAATAEAATQAAATAGVTAGHA